MSSGMPRFGQRAQDGMRIKIGAGISSGCLVAGVTRTSCPGRRRLRPCCPGIDALRDIGRLVVDVAARYAARCQWKFSCSYPISRMASPCHLDQSFAGDRSRTAHFAGEHHAVGCDQRLDAATRLRFGGKKVSTIASEMRSQILSG